MQDETNAGMGDALLKAKFLASALSLFFIDVMRLGEWGNQGQIDTLSNEYHIFQKYIALVESNYTKHHSVGCYLEELKVSQTTLSHCTHLCARVSPLKVITNRVILEAKRLLCNSSQQIKQIANGLGYEDLSYFVKLFKQHEGVTPSEFRTQYKGTKWFEKV